MYATRTHAYRNVCHFQLFCGIINNFVKIEKDYNLQTFKVVIGAKCLFIFLKKKSIIHLVLPVLESSFTYSLTSYVCACVRACESIGALRDQRHQIP